MIQPTELKRDMREIQQHNAQWAEWARTEFTPSDYRLIREGLALAVESVSDTGFKAMYDRVLARLDYLSADVGPSEGGK